VGRLLRERGRPELVHANVLTRPVYAAWRLASRWNIPFVVSEHSSEHLNGNWRRKHFLARTLDRFLMRRAAAITAVSPLLAEALRKAGLGRKIEVVPNVVPGLDQELPKSGPASNFLVVADLVDRTKNVSGVLRAMALVHAQGHPFRLEVIGDGPDGEALRALAATLGIDGHVHWHGRLPQREVLPVMALTGTVIINSNHETFSVVTGEALASGKPVIATRCGGPEAFITSANGMLVPIGDDTALAAAMISMAARHAEFPPAQVRASIDDRYTATAVGLRIDQTYRNALAHG
jgi:glycosyltransferase involved in cell wall biosynthesis